MENNSFITIVDDIIDLYVKVISLDICKSSCRRL